MSYFDLIEKLRPFPDILPRNWPPLPGTIPGIPKLPSETSNAHVPADYTVDGFLEEAFQNMLDSWRPYWFNASSQHLEDNVADHSSLLSRINDYRNAIVDLEASRIRAGLAYSAAMSAADADYELELARATDSAAVQEAAAGKRAKTKASIQDLQSRHSIPGGALNFNDRRTKLEEQLKLDMRSAYDRALSIQAGISRLNVPSKLAEDLPFPTADRRHYAQFPDARFFDDWLCWNRKILDYVERLQDSQEIRQVSFSVGLKSHYVDIVDAGMAPEDARPYDPDITKRQVTKVGIIVPDLIAKLKRRETVEVCIRRNTVGWPFVGEVGSSLALRSIALTATIQENQKAHWRFGANLRTPDGAVVTFATIPLLSDGPNWLTEASFYNHDPRGIWELQLTLNPLMDGDSTNDSRLDPTQWPLLDLQIHLRVAVMPNYGWDEEPDLGRIRYG